MNEHNDLGISDYIGFSTQEYDRRNADASYQTAKAFAEHLRRLIANSPDPSSNSIQISKKKLYEGFVYPKIAKEAWLSPEKRNFSESEQGDWVAYKAGLIEIDESVRPYRYTLIKKDAASFELRPYQKNIIEDATSAEGSVLIEAPTGSGKSVMASEIARSEVAKGGIVLIVAPKIILLEQLQETFSMLKPQIIHGARDYDKAHSVFISTIQTAHKRDLGFEPTMILIDEVHYGFSGKMIKKLLLDFGGRLIGLSATPYDERGEALQGFDLHIDRYDLKYMIESNYLMHPKCYAPLKVDLTNVSMVGVDYNQSDLDKVFNNLESISQIVESTREKILNRKASLVFCINIAHSEAVARAYSDAGIPTKAIHSKLTREEQKEILEAFKSGQLKMLANPMMLTTGFDHPITDTIILARATKSQNLYRQMVGRALRLSEGKRDAVILDCSNVIANLGLPTDEIKKRDFSQTKAVRVCSECKSERIFKKIERNRAYMQCAECGNIESAMENGYECDTCGLVHTGSATFKTREGDLYLICDDCGSETLVSEAASKEEMSLIFDSTYTDSLKKKITLAYFAHLMDKHTPEFVLEPMVSKHTKAIQNLIAREPSLFVDVDSHYFGYHSLCEEGDSSDSGLVWEMDFSKSDWRVFDESLEDELLNEGLKTLNEDLKASQNLTNSFNIIQKIRQNTGDEPLGEDFIEEILKDVSKSPMKDMEKILNKRLKALVFDKEDLYQLRGFTAMMESLFL